jgi:A/G-specific adenine glycosylase
VLIAGRDRRTGEERRGPAAAAARAPHGDLDALAPLDHEAGSAARRAWLGDREHAPILARYTRTVSRNPGGELLKWFRVAGRELPWRGSFPRDPYSVLVSEVMLQQTQVSRVTAAYRRFMASFPSLRALAAAHEEEVARAFSGLGYYRRVRLLHAAARAVVERGGFPESSEELSRLPGFGPYTTAAVAAFAFSGAEPPVDGNVARVAARVNALDLALGSAALAAAARAFAATLRVGRRSPAVWEALMELGATVCTPRTPRCGECPLAAGCRGRATGHPETYPRARPRRERERHTWVSVWLERDDGTVLLRRIARGSLLGGVWLPPFAPLAAGAGLRAAARGVAREAGFHGPLAARRPVRHAITHRDIVVHPFVGRASDSAVAEEQPDWSWQPPGAPRVPTSSLLGKLARACSAQGTPGEDVEG